jgi:hyperosmotically inducible periplasmic protein
MKRHNPVSSMIVAVAILGISGSLLATQVGDRIEASARKSYVFMTYLKGDEIKIQTAKDSVVTLTGTVSDWSHRSLAEETVAGLPGVKRVDDKLEVKGGKPDDMSDMWVGTKVKMVLLLHRNLSGFKTDVDVKSGTVTLTGQALSESQKELTTEYAKDVEGVKNVKNVMTVGKTEMTTVQKVSEFVDDASITAQVKLALVFHHATSAIGTKVETKDGVVMLSGKAENSTEKDLTGKLVGDIKGVKDVKNEMTVEK